MREADHVAVGAGSAGCALAERLSADGARRVLRLEAGPRDASRTIRMPGAVRFNLTRARYNRRFHSDAEPHLEGRRLRQPRGRVLGRSSAIDGM